MGDTMEHPPHVRAMLTAARAEGKAEGRREEREATLGYLWRTDHPRLWSAAAQIEAGQHVDLDGRVLFAVTLDNARAEGEAAGYRRAIDEACAAIDALYAGEGVRTSEGEYTRGKLDGFESAEDAVRALAPVEPVSPADELPGGTPWPPPATAPTTW